MEELDRTSGVDVMYTAEMVPPTADGALVYDIGYEEALKDTELTEVKTDKSQVTDKSHKFIFEKLDSEVKEYSVKIRTLVNGRTIASVSICKVFLIFTNLTWIISDYEGSVQIHKSQCFTDQGSRVFWSETAIQWERSRESLQKLRRDFGQRLRPEQH